MNKIIIAILIISFMSMELSSRTKLIKNFNVKSGVGLEPGLIEIKTY